MTTRDKSSIGLVAITVVVYLVFAVWTHVENKRIGRLIEQDRIERKWAP